MLVYVYDHMISYKKASYYTVDLDQESADEWVTIDYEERLKNAKPGETIQKRTPQEIQDVFNKEEMNKDRREIYRKMKYPTVSLDEGDDGTLLDTIISLDPTPQEAYEIGLDRDMENDFLESLTDVQRRRYLLYLEGKSYREIAIIEGGKNHNVIRESIKQVENKLKKIK